jgi:hypothetical protein
VSDKEFETKLTVASIAKELERVGELLRPIDGHQPTPEDILEAQRHLLTAHLALGGQSPKWALRLRSAEDG